MSLVAAAGGNEPINAQTCPRRPGLSSLRMQFGDLAELPRNCRGGRAGGRRHGFAGVMRSFPKAGVWPVPLDESINLGCPLAGGNLLWNLPQRKGRSGLLASTPVTDSEREFPSDDEGRETRRTQSAHQHRQQQSDNNNNIRGNSGRFCVSLTSWTRAMSCNK